MVKLYFSISEISELVDEEQHILRYWEKEFKQLNPRKNSAGNRKYSHKDLETIKLIKKLLRNDKLSLKGAKEKIDELQAQNFDLAFNHGIVKDKYVEIEPVPKTYVKTSENVIKTVDISLLLEIKEFLKEISAKLN